MRCEAVIIGHSFIRRLFQYTESADIHRFGLNRAYSKIDNISRGGATMDFLRQNMDKLLRYQVIIVHMGSNDLADTTVDPADLAVSLCGFVMDLFEYALEKKVTFPHVVLTSTLHRGKEWKPTHLQRDLTLYNDAVDKFNETLKSATATFTNCYLHYFHLRAKDYKTYMTNHLYDGVHLDQVAQDKFFRYIRGALRFIYNHICAQH